RSLPGRLSRRGCAGDGPARRPAPRGSAGPHAAAARRTEHARRLLAAALLHLPHDARARARPAPEPHPMTQTQRIFALVASLGTLLFILELVRRRRLREEYSWLWVLTSGSM